MKKEIIYLKYCRVPQVPKVFRFAVVKYQRKEEYHAVCFLCVIMKVGVIDKKKRQCFHMCVQTVSRSFIYLSAANSSFQFKAMTTGVRDYVLNTCT